MVPSVTVAVMVAVPLPTMVTAPVEALTVATAVFDEEYVTVPSPVFVSALVNAASP